MKKLVYVLVAATTWLLATCCLSAASLAAKPRPVEGTPFKENTFKEYTQYVEWVCHLHISKPEGFKDTKQFDVMWTANPLAPVGRRAADSFAPCLKSEDGQCLVLYAYDPHPDVIRGKASGRTTAQWEIESNLADQNGAIPSYRLEDYLTVTPSLLLGISPAVTDSIYCYSMPDGRKTSIMGNAKLEAMVSSNMPHCVCVNMYLRGESFMHMKLYLSDAGMAEKDVYLQKLFDSIR